MTGVSAPAHVAPGMYIHRTAMDENSVRDTKKKTKETMEILIGVNRENSKNLVYL